MRTRRAVMMESHNGLSNGVNGTANVSEVEHVTPIEVKTIVQDEVSQPANVEIQHEVSEIKSQVVQSEISEPIVEPTVEEPQSIAVVAPLVEDMTILPIDEPPQEVTVTTTTTTTQEVNEGSGLLQEDVTVQVTVVESSPEVIVPLTQEVNGGSTLVGDASPQPQVILDAPEVTPREVKDDPVQVPTNLVDAPVTKLPGNQPGTEFQVPLYAINALNRIAEEQGFTNYVINYDRGSNFGDGFVAEIVRAKISGSQLVKGAQEESELVLILKLPPDNKTRREQMGMHAFEREVTVYNEILPMFQKFQLDKGLKPGQGFISFPKCYYASHDKEKDEAVIIMEDIRKQGFKMLNKYKTVDFTHATAVLETLAQFHGLSLAMKDQCPGIFEKFKGLKDVMAEGMINDMMKSLVHTNCEKAILALEPHEENIKQKLRAFSENIFDIIKSSTDGESAEPYTVLNHGDCWINNIMFKYEVCA